MNRVSDHIVRVIRERFGDTPAFTVAGGGNMYLLDALKLSDFKVTCCHHEQACAMAAVSYTKLTNKPSLVIPTTGCAGTNTITGLLDAWQDSVPVLFISGQVNANQTCFGSEAKLRKFGVQEADIVSVVKPLTKYAVTILDSTTSRYHLEKALHECLDGRFGPVWIDVPLDVQRAEVDWDSLEGYTAPSGEQAQKYDLNFLKGKKRPIILAGNGVRLSGAKSLLNKVSQELNIPVVSTYLGVDLMNEVPENYIGSIGVKGSRAGNFAINNADLVISVGSSLSVAATGYKPDHFAREAELVVVDVDSEEHSKGTVIIDQLILTDCFDFLERMLDEKFNSLDWLTTCQRWSKKWIVTPEDKGDSEVDLYTFINFLDHAMSPNSVVVADAGSAFYVPCQSLRKVNKFELVVPGAQAEMGFTLPACIGASIARPNSDIIGITGDGSLQMNIQELETLRYLNPNVKLFVWNNGGYLSIRNTQDKFFEGRRLGSCVDSGVTLPDVSRIANAYNIPYTRINNTGECMGNIYSILRVKGPIIVEVMCKSSQSITPTLGVKVSEEGISSKPLEDMDPALPRDEFFQEMIINPL